MLDHDILTVALMTPGLRGRWGIPLLDIDAPGVGKTSTLEAFARTIGLPCKYLSPALHGEGMFGCVPVPMSRGRGTNARTYLGYPAPLWAIQIQEYGCGLVILDEATTAQPIIQAAMLNLANERRIGDADLGPGCRVLLAGNPIEQAAGGVPLSPAMANRLAHFKGSGVSVNRFCDFLAQDDGLIDIEFRTQDGLDFEPTQAQLDKLRETEQRVLSAWPETYASIRGLIAGFLSANAGALLKPPAANHPHASEAWPSPRTWHMAAKAAAGCHVHGYGWQLGDRFVQALVGEGAAHELATYRIHADLPDPKGVLMGSIPFQHAPHRADRTVALLASCVALTLQNPTQYNARMWQLLANIHDTTGGRDLVVMPARQLLKKGIQSSDTGDKLMTALYETMQLAGISMKGGKR